MSIPAIGLATLVSLGIGGGFTVTPTSEPRATQEGEGWKFSSLPHLVLWFHGMASVDPFGAGPQPLYDPSYPARMRAAKEESGVGPTPLDQQAGYFRDAFRADPAFEVFHFLPLYFPDATSVEFFSALEALAVTRDGIPRAASPRTAMGLAAIGAVLPKQTQRVVLGEFVAGLEAEDLFFRRLQRELAADQETTRRTLQQLWDSEFGPGLQLLLEGLGLSGGTVVLSDALGPEGRVFSGSRRNARDNILVVSGPKEGEGEETVIFSMLRELTFSMARRVLSSVGADEAPGEVPEELVVRGAVRSGALIMERFFPENLTTYQQFYLTREGHSLSPEGDVGAFFQAAFPLKPSQADALRAEITALSHVD